MTIISSLFYIALDAASVGFVLMPFGIIVLILAAVALIAAIILIINARKKK